MDIYRPTYSEAEVRDAVEHAHNVRSALRRLGLPYGGGNYRTLHRLIAHYGISTDRFDSYRDVGGPRQGLRVPLEDVLVEGSTYKRHDLKRRLYEEGLKERRCELCGQGRSGAGSPCH
jgi:hypothetical protein